MEESGGMDEMTYTCLSTVTNAASQFENTYNNSNSNQQDHVMYVNASQATETGMAFTPAAVENGVPAHTDTSHSFQGSTGMNVLPQNGGRNSQRNMTLLYQGASAPVSTTTSQSAMYSVRSGGDAQTIATMAPSSAAVPESQGQSQQHLYTGEHANKTNADARHQYYIINTPSGGVNGNVDGVIKNQTSSSPSNVGQGDNVTIDVDGSQSQNGTTGNNTVVLLGANQLPLQMASGSQYLTMSTDQRNLVAMTKELQGVDHSEEPLYVNAKQYHRILKRREARARLEALGKIPKQRKKYLHESRHMHAINRRRMLGGKFATKP